MERPAEEENGELREDQVSSGDRLDDAVSEQEEELPGDESAES